MAITLSGAPKSVVEAVDASIIQQPSPKGIFCIQVVTERGIPSTPVYVTSWIDAVRKLGSFIEGFDGTYQLKKILDRGGKAWVSRIGHYTDVSDKSTLQGTKATITKVVATTAETLATGTYVITGAGATGNEVELVVNNGVSIITLGSYTVVALDTVDDIATGLRSAVNALTGTHGYAASGADENVIITAPVGTGDLANSYVLGINITGTVTATITQFSGGITEILAGDAGTSVWSGKSIGPGYAGISITTVVAKSGLTGKVDIRLEVPNLPELTVNVIDFPRVPTVGDITNLNNKLGLATLDSFITRLPYGVATLAGGIYNTTLFTDNDIIGNSVAKTGNYSFDSVTNASRLVNVERVSPAIDAACAAYVVMRKDMLVRLAMPKDLTFQEAIDYRRGQGIYSHTPIDTWQANYTYGDVNFYDPLDSSKDLILSGVGEVCGIRAVVDSKFGEWISESGGKRGIIGNNKGLVRNIGAQSEQGTFDTMYDNSINAVIGHESFGVVMWGNRSLLRDQSKLLSKQNIAELMVYIIRSIKPIADSILFDPNDPQSWNELYRKVRPFIQNLEAGRAIVRGENKNWFWIGDQDADQVTDAVFNTQNDLNSGRYRARFVFIPISAIEYIGIEATATDSNSLQFAVVENPL